MNTYPITQDLVFGMHELEPTVFGYRPQRVPKWARARGDSMLRQVSSEGAGVRVVFMTTATRVELRALAARVIEPHRPPRPHGIFDVVVDHGNLRDRGDLEHDHWAGGGDVVLSTSLDDSAVVTIDLDGCVLSTPGEPGVIGVDLDGSPCRVEFWLPHNEAIHLVDLRADGAIAPIDPTAPRWMHYGSSISQGKAATNPLDTWVTKAGRRAGVDMRNLGVGGSALLDPFMGRVLRDFSAEFISLEIGINIVTTDMMRRRAFAPAVQGFIDTIRDAHPTTPVIIMSPIYCGLLESTPGPVVADEDELERGIVFARTLGDPADIPAGKLTLEVIREDLARVVAERSRYDVNLSYVDGLSLFGADDAAAMPLVDGVHPSPEAHALIAQRFTDQVFGPSGSFQVCSHAFG
jgi:hypothetical protein